MLLAFAPASLKNALPPQASSQPLPAPAPVPANAPVISLGYQAAKSPSNPLPNSGSLGPPEVANPLASASTDSSGSPLVNSPENLHVANPLPNSPTKLPSKSQGLGAIIAGAIRIFHTSPPNDQDIQPSPWPTQTSSYSISIAPSASLVVINGITSILPASGSEGGLVAGILPIAVGSQQISRNAASQYVVASQTITPGAPAINVQGTKVSLAPSANAIVIAGSTIALSSTSVPAFTAGAEIFTANSASQYVAGEQTISPGGPAVTISGTRISLAPSATEVVVGSRTIGLAPTSTPPLLPPPPLTFGSQTYSANSKAEYTIAGQILSPGGPVITVSGTRLSLAPSATQVIVGSNTIRLSPVFTPPPLTFGSRAFTANSESDYVIDGQTLAPGAPAIIVSGTPISLAPGATQAVIGSSTVNLAPATVPPLLTFGSQTFTANSASNYIIDGQTLIPGAPAITISNTAISLAPDISEVVIGGSTEILRSSPTLSTIVIGSQTFTANSAFDYIIDGHTLNPGAAAINVSPTQITLAPDGSEAVIGGHTSNLDANPTLPAIIIGSQTVTANNAGLYKIGSQTLTPGASGIVVPASLLTPGAPLSVFTVAGQIFTANPTAFSIDGTTISAGGPGVTISGTRVSLQASGILAMGNSTVGVSGASATDGRGRGAFTGEGERTGPRGRYAVVALLSVYFMLYMAPVL